MLDDESAALLGELEAGLAAGQEALIERDRQAREVLRMRVQMNFASWYGASEQTSRVLRCLAQHVSVPAEGEPRIVLDDVSRKVWWTAAELGVVKEGVGEISYDCLRDGLFSVQGRVKAALQDAVECWRRLENFRGSLRTLC